jgi:hypothetical protein
MKKLIFISTLIALICVSSCKKSDINAAGSWAFEGVRYTAGSAAFSTSDSALTATSGSNSNSGTLAFYFPSATVRSGSYKVANFDSLPLPSDQLYIKFINGSSSFYYFSEGNDNVNATVTVSPAGKISVTVVSVYLKAYSRPTSDSAQLTATIHQQ